jgi:ferric-dicitrate binding protein FerR (iron transport regulator)
MERETIIQKWLNDTLSAEERKHFEEDEAFAPTRRLRDALQAFKAPAYDVESERARLLLSGKGKVRHMGSPWIKPFIRVAASLLVLFTLYYLFVYEPYTVVETAAGEQKELILPDGSKVHLNAQSSLRYVSQSWDKERSLALEGEAFFSVEKGRSFEVRTDAGSVRVLGTKFNVRQRTDLFEVDCYEGLVQVSYPGETRKLAAHQGVSVIRGTAKIHAPGLENRPSWLAGESVFRSIPYIYVVEELERQYGVKVTLHNIDTQQLFTGSFIHADLNVALQTITQPLGTSFRIDKKHNTAVIGE